MYDGGFVVKKQEENNWVWVRAVASRDSDLREHWDQWVPLCSNCNNNNKKNQGFPLLAAGADSIPPFFLLFSSPMQSRHRPWSLLAIPLPRHYFSAGTLAMAFWWPLLVLAAAYALCRILLLLIPPTVPSIDVDASDGTPLSPAISISRIYSRVCDWVGFRHSVGGPQDRQLYLCKSNGFAHSACLY